VGEHPEAMSVALVGHDELLRDAIEGHGGGVFKHTGDGVSAVFGLAVRRAVAAIGRAASVASQALGGDR